MDIVKIMHHFESDDYLDEYLVNKNNPKVQELIAKIKEGRRRKKEAEKNSRGKDGIGLLEIVSSVCARHPSINPTNIKQLNYYQLIDQFKRLNLIDSYNLSTATLASGNLSEEGRKNIKHYSEKVD